MGRPVYKRVLLKIGGEGLGPEQGRGVDFAHIGDVCDQIVKAHSMDVGIGLVVGAGNIFRGREGEAHGLDATSRDYMGMLATVINALAVQAVLENRGVPTRVMTAIEMRPVAEPYIRRRALRHLEKGRVVIFGAGTGNPFFTTDTAAALRANEIEADVLMKATKVDGVYDSDPEENPDAKKYEELSYTDVLAQNLRVMDATAISLCRAHSLPILVFNLTESGSIIRALQGERVGTIVRGE